MSHYPCILICLFVTSKTGSRIIKSRMLLLSSCWKHYSVLVCLDNRKGSLHYKQLLEQYLSGLQVRYGNNLFDILMLPTAMMLVYGLILF